MTGGSLCDQDHVRYVTESLMELSRAAPLPAAQLATPTRECLDLDPLKETLARWEAAGAIIGNHTATHPDLNHTGIEAHVSKIERGQRLIDDAIETEGGGRWFRAPMLHTGDEPAKPPSPITSLQFPDARPAPTRWKPMVYG